MVTPPLHSMGLGDKWQDREEVNNLSQEGGSILGSVT